MRFRQSLLLTAAVVLPVVLTLGLVGRMVDHAGRQLERQAAVTLASQRKDAEVEGMKRLVRMAIAQLKVLQAQTHLGTAEQKRLAQELLTRLDAGQDYYVFVYDRTGWCWVQPKKTKELVGKNQIGLVVDGQAVIRDLIDEAIHRRNGGLLAYRWQQPSTLLTVDKLGYVEEDPVWHWVIGTGMYLDNVELAARQLDQPLAQARRNLHARLLMLALVLVPAGVLVALVVRHWLVSTRRTARPAPAAPTVPLPGHPD